MATLLLIAHLPRGKSPLATREGANFFQLVYAIIKA